MKLVRSDSPEVVHSIASAGAWASREWQTRGFAYAANILAVVIVLVVSFSVSVRAATWLSVPALLALNGYVLWRAKASHQRWVIVGCAERLYIRLFAWPSGNHDDVHDPDVLVLEASEVASMSIKSLEVFVYGPEPNSSAWLKIEPAQVVADDISRHVRPLLRSIDHSDKTVLVTDEEGYFTIEWKWWRPALQVFLQQVAQECPSIVIGTEERSELDLNGIWKGRKSPDAQQRQMLLQAKLLGFGCECTQRISQYKHMSLKEAAAYMAEIEQEGGAAPSLDCR